MKEIISQKFHHITLFQKHFQVLVGCLGARVPVKGGHIVVHHQDDFLSLAALPGPEWIGISGVDTLLFKFLRPFFLQLFTVLHLVAFQTCSVYIRTVGNTLKVDHLGERLVDNPVSGLSHLKSQIRILAVSRGKPLVKSANPLPQSRAQQDGRPRYIVHILYIIVFCLVRIIQTAVVPAGTVTPDNASCFLEASVRVHQLGSDHADGRIGLNQVHQGGNPAFCHLGVIIEEHDVFSPGSLCRLVAVAQETLVCLISADYKSIHIPVQLCRRIG